MSSPPENSAQALMTLEGVSQSYRIGDRVIPVLRNISLSLWRGGTCALLGASGSGKSTLLNILGLLDRPTSGRFHFADHAMHRPAELSGGQCQRVAIARALIGDPSVILADEPTGNLDSTTATDVMDLLLALNREQGVTLVVVTHDPSVAKQLNRQIEVFDGKVHEASIPEAGGHA